MSIDHLVAAIDVVRQQLDRAQSGVLTSGQISEVLQAQFEALGATDKAGALARLQSALDDQAAKVQATQLLADQTRARAEALRGNRAQAAPSAGALSAFPTSAPQATAASRDTELVSTWVSSVVAQRL